MALTDRDAPGPSEPGFRAWWRHLADGENASAAAELVILLPVYFLLLIGIFGLGNVMFIRQSMVVATRNAAFDVNQPSPPSKTIDGVYRGRFDFQVQSSGDGFGFGKAQYSSSDLPYSSTGTAIDIALAALNNQGGNSPAVSWRHVIGTYEFEGLSLTQAPITQRTQCATLLPKSGHKRKVYDASQGNPVAAWPTNPKVEPLKDENLPLSPKYQGFFDKEEGVWDTSARLRGSMDSEHSYYEGKVR